MDAVQEENETLKQLTSPEAIKEMEDIKKERDSYKEQCEEMTQFLKDYGLTWIGGEGGQRQPEGNLDVD